MAESKLSILVLFPAVGCPDPLPHTNAWVRRMGETLVAKCNNTDETWYLTCHNTEWIGEIGNCTEGKSTTFIIQSFVSFSHGIQEGMHLAGGGRSMFDDSQTMNFIMLFLMRLIILNLKF